jgi:RNA polymerase sigma-70 factor, ECF subfamily
MPPRVDETSEEASTLQAAIAGDAHAFAELFRIHYQPMHAYAYRLCLHAADAEDVTQETFIRAARALGTYHPDAPFRHWLYRICTNAARDSLRRQGRRQRLADEAETRQRIDDGARPPDHELARDALASLPEPLRSAVALVFFEGLNHRAAARVLGCAETTVSWRIFVAKKQLKAFYRRHE